MTNNTVRKYVQALENNGLIRTEPTDIRTKSGRKRNGNLLYTIRPIQEAIDIFNERQMIRAEAEMMKQRAAKKLAEYDRRHADKPMPASSASESAAKLEAVS